MAASLIQQKSAGTGGSGAPLSVAFVSNVTAGSLLVASAEGNTITGISDNVNGAWTKNLTITPNANVNIKGEIWSFPNAASGATTVTLALDAAVFCTLQIYELGGMATASVVDATAQASTDGTSPSFTLTTTVANSVIIVGGQVYDTNWVATAGSGFTLVTSRIDGGINSVGEYMLDAGATGGKTVAFSFASGAGGEYSAVGAVAYKIAAVSSSSFSKPLWPMSYF